MNTLLVARKEILEHLLSLKFYVCLFATALLVALSVFVMYRDYDLRLANHAVLRERARPRTGEQSVLAVVPPRPLSLVAKGLDETMDRGYDVTAYLGVAPHARQTPADSLFSLFAPPDLLYIVKVLLSLIALLFSYDAVTGERERGTLKLILSQPISRGELVAGKMLGGLAVITVPFLGVLLVALLALAVSPALSLGGAEYARLALMGVAAALYVSLFYALGVLVSACARRSAGALVVLLFVWAGLVFAVPSAGNLIAAQTAPVASAETQETARLQAFAKNRFLGRRSGRNPEGTFEAFNSTYDRQVEQFRAKLDLLVDRTKTISRLSPAATLSYVFTDLAGTGLAEQRRLTAALVDFKSRNLPALTRMDSHAAPRTSVFEFPPEPLGSVIQRGFLVDLAVLAFMTAALFMAATVAFARTDPR